MRIIWENQTLSLLTFHFGVTLRLLFGMPLSLWKPYLLVSLTAQGDQSRLSNRSSCVHCLIVRVAEDQAQYAQEPPCSPDSTVMNATAACLEAVVIASKPLLCVYLGQELVVSNVQKNRVTGKAGLSRI